MTAHAAHQMPRTPLCQTADYLFRARFGAGLLARLVSVIIGLIWRTALAFRAGAICVAK